VEETERLARRVARLEDTVYGDRAEDGEGLVHQLHAVQRDVHQILLTGYGIIIGLIVGFGGLVVAVLSGGRP